MAITEETNPIDKRLDKVESACIELAKGQTEIKGRLDKIDGRLEGVEGTCIRLQKGIADLQRGQARLEKGQVKLEKGQVEINKRLDGMDDTLKLILERIS